MLQDQSEAKSIGPNTCQDQKETDWFSTKMRGNEKGFEANLFLILKDLSEINALDKFPRRGAKTK
jgi:hypothetical protein